jgi:SPP1 gp7 family putative phage head morphogenesis protein
MTISINFNLPFNEAIAQMAARGVVLPDVYYGQLQGLHKQLAFSIAGIAKVDQLQAVLDSLTEHLKNGGTFASWQKHVVETRLIASLPKHRLDNIFRTNIQQAYNHGHWQQALANKSTHGYLLYDAINDSRTRPSHKANDGIIRKIDDPIWKRIWFSRNVYRCRCRLISLTEQQAFDRSGDGKGIYKTATEDPLRDKAWDSVDVMNMDVLSFGVEQAVAKRLTDTTINPVLKSAFNNALGTFPDMKIIALDGFETVQKAMTELVVKKPEWFPDGFNGIHAVANDNLFAATENNTIYFSQADKLASGFKPAIELKRAVSKINAQQALSFNEEYALETLWHEMKHIDYKHRMPASYRANTALEGSVQFVARHSYLLLLSEMNIAVKHQQTIISSGYAYDVPVTNFRTLIAELKLNELQSALVVDDVLKRSVNVDNIINELATALSIASSYSVDKIAYGLKNLNRQFGFKEKLIRKLGY